MDNLSQTLFALSDPTRRAILSRLASGEATVAELTAPFALSQPAISKHLKVLEQANLITRGRAAQSRPCYLRAAPLEQVADWTEEFRWLWEQRLDRLDIYLQQLQQPEPETRKTKPTGVKKSGIKKEKTHVRNRT
ncbi:MAG TPA: metalloregulator ArsR/SmtB family transcription factor [Acidobacteriaceae bacterium]|nr:metalloregulator ArsR/SmtB family transcription factor [Acidobacteriaceae bacterium]